MQYIPTNLKINLEWSVKKGIGNEAEDFSRATVSLFLFSDENRWAIPCEADYTGAVKAELPETLPEGVYSLDLLWIKNDKSINETRCVQRTRKTHVFAIDASTNPPAGYNDQPITIKMSTIAAPYGYDGLSAYEIAVLRGTTARSEKEWANYPGPKGDSIVKTEAMYLASEKSQGITLETAGWEPSIVNPTPTKKYLWSYQTLFLDNGGVLTQNPSIVGIYGDQGVQGPIGLTPLLRYETDEVQVSYDKGNSYQRLVSMTNNFRISKYVSSFSSLPTDVPEGTAYMVGPTFRADDTAQANPVYRMWVYAWKDNTLAWQDNGEFTSISAGVVQETGNSATEVMSQKAVTEKLTELESVRSVSFMNNSNENYFNVDTVKGTVTVLTDLYWGYSYGRLKDNHILSGTEFTIKPSEFRSQVDRGGGLVKFAFDMNTGAIATLHYLDLIKSSEIIIGMASSAYGTTYSSFNWIHFNTDWNYTIDGISPTGSGGSTIFTRNADELELMETFGASTWDEEYNYNRYGEGSGWIPKLSLIHVSDTHASRNHIGNNYDIITQELVAFANKVSTNRGTNFNRGNRVKCVVHSGDIKYSVGSDDFTYYADAVIKSNIPFFHALGNHDIGNESTMLVEYAITDAQAYEQMIAPFLELWNLNCANPGVCEAHPEGKCYFFNDFEAEKIRLITLYGFETRFELDESDSTKLKYRRDIESWSQEQIDWLVNSLLNLPEGWGVMINQHYPFGTSTGESAFLSYTKCSRSGELTIINDIVQAFMDGMNLVQQYTQTDIVTPILSVNCDFSQKKSGTEFIAFLSGHTHRDCIGWIEDYPKQLQLNVGCNNTFYDEGSDVTHEMGKKGQDMFNVYCVDRNNGLINILRVGANFSCYGHLRHLETIKYRKGSLTK